jgi:hypothetical protein
MTVPEARAVAVARDVELWKLCRDRHDPAQCAPYADTPDSLRAEALDVLCAECERLENALATQNANHLAAIMAAVAFVAEDEMKFQTDLATAAGLLRRAAAHVSHGYNPELRAECEAWADAHNKETV